MPFKDLWMIEHREQSSSRPKSKESVEKSMYGSNYRLQLVNSAVSMHNIDHCSVLTSVPELQVANGVSGSSGFSRVFCDRQWLRSDLISCSEIVKCHKKCSSGSPPDRLNATETRRRKSFSRVGRRYWRARSWWL